MKTAPVIWFTGLSGSGKTTIAQGVADLLREDGFDVLILDGDVVRARLHVQLGFTESDIKRNNELIAAMCLEYRSVCDIILVPIISPFRSSRRMARDLLGKNFYEVFCTAGVETVSRRDVKGLYARARRNEITDLIGFSPGAAAYEPPLEPDVVMNTSEDQPEESIRQLHQFICSLLE